MNFSIILRYLYRSANLFSNKKQETSKQQEQSTSAEQKTIVPESDIPAVSLPEEILEELCRLAKQDVLTKKEEARMNELVTEHEDCAREIYMKLPLVQRARISSILYIQKKGRDLAEIEARQFVDEQELIDCTDEHATNFRRWLTGELETFTEPFPADRCISTLDKKTSSNLCFMSNVHTLPERLWVYGASKGYIDIAREPVKEMIRELGSEYAQEFLKRIQENYPVSEEKQMQIIALIYIAPHKLKKEIELYGAMLQDWIKQKPKEFWHAIAQLDQDKQKKIKNVLSK